ncbi:MAG: Hpt domain-containing protein [Vallitalea sp.]|nr:Hpt domain-containing protein [Vallitalea sp.]
MDNINITTSHIDYNSAMEKLAASLKLYKIILVGFKDKYSNAYEVLISLSKDNRYNDSRILVHSIKGVCGNLGAFRLQDLAKSLEKSYKNKDNIHIQLLEEFSIELKLVIEDINRLLECINKIYTS